MTTPQLRIDSAEVQDAAEIRRLAIESNIDAWSETDYADEIVRADSLVLKATLLDKIHAFVVSRIVPGTAERPDADLYNIAVAEDFRRAGIGSRLFCELLTLLMERSIGNVWLEVRESNRDAIRFYEKQGFRAEATRQNFYSNPNENAIIMRLRLQGENEIAEP